MSGIVDDDIPTELRKFQKVYERLGFSNPLFLEAADEIERLEKIQQRLGMDITRLIEEKLKLRSEIKQLKERLGSGG